MKTASEVLREAAARVDEGWAQGALVHRGNVCAVGALCHALFGKAGYFYVTPVADGLIDSTSPTFYEVVKALAAAMKEQFVECENIAYSGYVDTIVDINDEHAKDKSEIIAAMEKAANSLEEQGR